MQGWLLLGVCCAGAVAAMGFLLGDRRRRRASGQAGPRPAPSIGEAVALAERRDTRALVLFLGEDEPSMQVGQAFAEDGGVLELIRRHDLAYVVLRESLQGAEVLGALYEKYAQGTLPTLPAGLLLNAQGEKLRATSLSREDPRAWLNEWLGTARPSSA